MFTWKETAAVSVIGLLKDPELVRYFMSILMPLRDNYIFDEAQKFHQSLRLEPGDRWKGTEELKNKGQYHLMNSCVPITCKLPFDGSMWRNSLATLKSIKYLRDAFIRSSIVTTRENGVYEYTWTVHRNACFSDKIEAVNLITDGGIKGQRFRSQWETGDINLALEDFINQEEADYDSEEFPYILIKTDPDAKYLDVKYLDIIN